MKVGVKLIGSVCVVALAGCQSLWEGEKAASEKCVRGPDPGVCRGNVCKIDVAQRADGKTEVSPYELRVGRDTGPIRILWKLKEPNKYEFLQEDGPKDLKNEVAPGKTGDFSNGAPTDDEDGATTKPRGKNYRMAYANQLPGQRYSYVIQYREKTADGKGKVFSCDPYINNQGG